MFSITEQLLVKCSSKFNTLTDILLDMRTYRTVRSAGANFVASRIPAHLEDTTRTSVSVDWFTGLFNNAKNGTGK